MALSTVESSRRHQFLHTENYLPQLKRYFFQNVSRTNQIMRNKMRKSFENLQDEECNVL